jgi:two-component system chemotaxis response regulator CheY
MKRCLVVDDSRVIRRVAAKIIQDLGFAVEEAEGGKQALAACRTQMPDLALIDVDMPEMDGRATLAALRALPGGDKVVTIFCATESEPHRIAEHLDLGVDEYILKPFDSDIVRSKLLLLDML